MNYSLYLLKQIADYAPVDTSSNEYLHVIASKLKQTDDYYYVGHDVVFL